MIPIQANEIRVGNRFRCYGMDIIVDAINSTHVRYSREGEFLIADLHPIPLTPEILKRCGFTTAYESTHDTVLIMNLHSDKLSFQFHSDYNKGIFVSNKEEDNSIIFPCQSLHQLQNLYFALTGKELPIKQPLK